MDGDGVAVLILRLFVGLAVALHGHGKVRKVRVFAGKFGLPMPVAIFVVYAQLVGGCLLIAGLFTSIASAAISVTMIGAISKCIGRGEKFVDPEKHSWESAGFYLAAVIVIVILGPGPYSLDFWLFG